MISYTAGMPPPLLQVTSGAGRNRQMSSLPALGLDMHHTWLHISFVMIVMEVSVPYHTYFNLNPVYEIPIVWLLHEVPERRPVEKSDRAEE
ncbi:uncharacterized protein DS421_15g503880 [Arachis hypogaea]|nr:uncharacterized protein DS421_20g695250 [Arachis hypogaea]QHO12093.1 uncharacterized protein DS421_15g503880 [Arachis hypogaea]